MDTLSKLFALVVFLGVSGGAQAVGEPVRFSYQAKLTDGSGTLLSGAHTIFVKLFAGGDAATADSGTLVYSETHTPTLDGGVVNLTIGAGGSPSPASLDTGLMPLTQTYYLQVAVDTVDNVLLPRVRIMDVPVATQSRIAESASALEPSDNLQEGSISYNQPLSTLEIRNGTFPTAVDQSQVESSFDSDETLLEQTFTAGFTGSLTKIDVQRFALVSADIQVTDMADAVLGAGSVPATGYTAIQSVAFGVPPVLNAGQMYKIKMSSTLSKWSYSDDNPYPWGQGATPTSDFWFRTVMSGAGPAVKVNNDGSIVTAGDLTLGSAGTKSTITMGAPFGDKGPMIVSRTIPAGQNASFERTELLLFHSNDNSDNGGPDYITLRAPSLRLQTYDNPGITTPDNPDGSNDRLMVEPDGDITIYEDLTVEGDINLSGAASKAGGGSWATLSDASLKKNVSTLNGALEKLSQLRGVIYEWKNPTEYGGTEEPVMGFVADEVENVFPEWVGRNSEGLRTLEIKGFEGLTVEAMKELEAKNKELEAKLEALTKRLEELENQRNTEH